MSCDLDLIDVEIEEYDQEEVKRLLGELDAMVEHDGEGKDERAALTPAGEQS